MACSTIADLTRPSRIRPETSDEKSSRQSGADPVDDAWRRLQYPLDQHLCIGSEMALLCHGVEMAPLDVLEPVMLVLAGKRHRQLGVVQRELIRLFAFHRPDRHHVVDRREPVAAFRQQRDAEILRMAVRGVEHPEQQLHGDEHAQVFFRVYRKTQHVRQVEHSGATVGLVLEMCSLPSAWQKSSCGRRNSQLPDGCIRRSKRSTASTVWAPNLSMAVRGTGTPYSCRMFRHSHSFSTEVVKSALRWPTRPSGNFRMCVVGVAPMGCSHCPSCHRSAVFSWAPASEMRSSSSGVERPPAPPGSTVRCNRRSTALSSIAR